MVQNKNINTKPGDFIKKLGYNPKNAYPNGKEYLYLNTKFKKLKKETQINYAKSYDIILSNSNHRELVFHGVYCILTPKEYFLVEYLLQNLTFNNKNFEQARFIKKNMEKRTVKVSKRTFKNKLLFKRDFKKNTVRKQIYYINLEHMNKAKNLIKILREGITQKKLVLKSRALFSSAISEIYNIKNKINKKIKDNMLQQNIEIDDFEQKFNLFIDTKKFYYYEEEYPNEYATVRTSYNVKNIPSRVKCQKK